MDSIDQLIETLLTIDELVAVVTIVAAFFILIVMLWTWRRLGLRKEEEVEDLDGEGGAI